MTDKNETSVHIIRWQNLRARLQKEMVQCHDCRMLRNALIVMMDILIPPEGTDTEEAPPVSDPHTIKAHSEVLIKEPTTRIEAEDGTRVTLETPTKVL